MESQKVMVRIRLRRVGAKKRPFYRIVVADQRTSQNGAFIEQVGTYDPIPETPVINVDEQKIIDWIKKGAQASDSVNKILKTSGLMEKINA